jgi:hypothetical protein
MYVPMIAHEEQIDGYLGRIKVLSQTRDMQKLRKILVSQYRQSEEYNKTRKDEVSDLIDVIVKFTGKTRYQLIRDHTCMPTEYWDWQLLNWDEHLRTRNAATLPFLKYQKRTANLCRKCIDSDKNHIGASVWYRKHQVDGVTFCPSHSEEQLLQAKSSTDVYKYLPEWYLQHRELEPAGNYPIRSSTHQSKIKLYGELIASLMSRREQVSDFVLLRIIEKLKHKPLNQGHKRYVTFESAYVPKTWFMSSKYPRRWLWTHFHKVGNLDFYLPSANQIQRGRWNELVLVIASFAQSVEQIDEMIVKEMSGIDAKEMLANMRQSRAIQKN